MIIYIYIFWGRGEGEANECLRKLSLVTLVFFIMPLHPFILFSMDHFTHFSHFLAPGDNLTLKQLINGRNMLTSESLGILVYHALT